MTSIVSVSSTELKNRRQELQRRRRYKLWQGLWRSLLISGMTGGIVWILTLSDWIIRQPQQIYIEGNKFLSSQAIRSLIPLSYPRSLLHIPTHQLSQQLEATGPIAEAMVTRQLLPPRLTIEVAERRPVAISSNPQTESQENKALETIGFLDEQGIWTPKSSYTNFGADLELPELVVIEMNNQIRPYWSDIYPELHRSTVKILSINFQDLANITLETELGTVHLGPYSVKFKKQLTALASMGDLPTTQIAISNIDYIDLKEPDSPIIYEKKELSTSNLESDRVN